MVKRDLILGGALVLFSSVFVSNTYAVSDTTDFNIKVNPSLSISVSSNAVGFQLTPTQEGNFGSASFNVYASTNNPTGYKIIMSTDKVDLESNTINPTTGTKPTIPTLAQGNISYEDFDASTDPNVLNHYGVAIKNGNYNAMQSTQEIEKTTVNNVTEDTIAISLASKLNLLTVPGIYSTTLNFQIVANMYTTGGKINENGRYPANSLLRAFEIAYTEAGKPMYIEDANTDIGWRPMVGADFDTVGGKEVRFAIQDITMTFEENGQTKNVCEWAMASAADSSYIDIAEVMDLRDGTSYYIVKAPDDRCWLADNLALNPADNDVKLRLNSSNTNASDAALRNLTGIQSTTNPGWATTPVTTTSGNPYSYTNPYVNIDNKDVVSPNQVDQEHGWKDGVYYSICAISAGTYCYPSNESDDVANTAIDLTEDLCPAGWRLPTSGTVAGEGQDAAEYATVLTSLASGHTSGDLVLMLRLPHSIGPGWQAGSSAYFYSSTICGAGCIRMVHLSDYYEPNYTSVSYFLQNARCIAK